MRVLITNTGPWGTGSGTVADAVMQELLSRGHEVKAFFPDVGFPGAGYEKYYGNKERYHIVPFPAMFAGEELYTFPLMITDPNPRNYQDAWTFKRMSEKQLQAYFGYMRQELEQVLRDFRPDVVECQHIWALDHIVYHLGYSFACVAHHSDQMGFRYDERMRPYALRSAEAAKYIFAISPAVRQDVLELYGVAEDKVVVIKNGYNREIFKPFPVDRTAALARFGLERYADLPLITFCGKVSKTKGIDVLLQANRLIQARHKAVLLILGGGDLEEMCRDIQGSCSMENVVYLGHHPQEDLAVLHNLAKLSVLPSRSEGFGIAALEAMACGIPLVATRVGGLADFAVGGLVPPEDPAALAAAINAILEMREEPYRKVCAAAQEKANEYSWSSIVDKRLMYYEEIAAENRQRKIRIE